MILLILLIVLLLCFGGGTYYTRRPGYQYAGPSVNWLLLALLLLFVWWLYTQGVFGR